MVKRRGAGLEGDSEESEEGCVLSSRSPVANDENQRPTKSPRTEEQERNRQEELARWAARGYAQVGILEMVRVENFMCHKLFEFRFGPNVNIVNGNNGSGKSATVAALQLGLGGSVRQTERGKALADCIRHGESYAIIKIRIRNRPPPQGTVDQRYRPDLYGDAIIIEKRISRDGTNTLKFRDHMDRKVHVSEKPREELDRILENIQVDNPVAILTQQRSKQFLLQGKPSDFYKFFMCSTLLERWRQDLVSTQSIRDQVDVILEKKRKLLPEIEKQLGILKDRFDASQEMVGLQQRIDDLKNLYAWTSIAELEDELKSRLQKIEEEENRLERFDEEHESVKNCLLERRALSATRNQEMEDTRSCLHEQREKLSQIKTLGRKAISELQQTKLTSRHTEKLLDSAKGKLENLTQGLERERRNHEAQSGERGEVERRLGQLGGEQERLIESIKDAEVQEKHADGRLVRFKKEMDEIEHQARAMEKKVQGLTSQLKELQSMKGDDLRRFGNEIPRIVSLIRENSTKVS